MEDPSDKAAGNLLYCCSTTAGIKGTCWVTESITLLWQASAPSESFHTFIKHHLHTSLGEFCSLEGFTLGGLLFFWCCSCWEAFLNLSFPLSRASQKGCYPPEIRSLFSCSSPYLTSAPAPVSWRWGRAVVQSVLDGITPAPFTICVRNTLLDIFRCRICLFRSLIVVLVLTHYDAPGSVVLIHVQVTNSQLVWCTGILVLISCALQPSTWEIIPTETSAKMLNIGGSHKAKDSKPLIKKEICVLFVYL